MSRRFRFKAVRPTFDLNPFRVNGEPQDDGKTVKPVGPGPRGLADDGRRRDAALRDEGTRPCNRSKGLTVVTLEHAIAAPFATRQLADLGARVIKIERPGVGDFARGYDAPRARPRLALRLDQPLEGKPHARRQAPRAAEVLERLVLEKADVVVQNLAPGAAARLGLGYEVLAAKKPGDHRLRHLRLRRGRPVPRQEGLRPADPERGGLRVGHRHAGRAVQGRPVDRRHRGRACTPTPTSSPRCCSAQQTGAGQHIDISMLESLAEWTSYPLYYAFDGAPPPPRTGAAHATIYPYGPFPTGPTAAA